MEQQKLDFGRLLDKDCASYKELSKEEEIECFKKYYATNDEEYKNKITLGYIGLIKKIASKVMLKHPNKEISFLDLVQSGYIGIEKAFNKFDITKGNKFSTYAYLYIEEEMRVYLEEFLHIIHIPENITKDLAKIRKVSSEFTNEMGREPSISELAEMLGEDYDEEYIIKVFNACLPIDSLNRTLNEEDGLSLLDTVKSYENKDDIFDDISNKDMVSLLEDVVNNLSEDEKYVYNHFNGTFECEKMTLQEIADELSISKDDVRKIKDEVTKYIEQEMKKIIYS